VLIGDLPPAVHVKNLLPVPQVASGNVPYAAGSKAPGYRLPCAQVISHGSLAQQPTKNLELC